MNELRRYLNILRRIQAKRPDLLTQKDYQFFLEFSQKVDQTAIEKYQNTEEFKKLPAEEQAALSSEALINSNLMLLQQPEFKQQMLDLAQSAERDRMSKTLQSSLNAILSGVDIATSIGQIREGRQAEQALVQPAQPQPLSADPRLDAALAEARQGNYGTERALAPAQLALLDTYLSDLNVARTASGGQAGIYGALGQEAGIRRQRGALGLAPLADQITRQGEARYDDLLRMKLAENQAIQQSRAQFYPYQLDQYNRDVEAAGALGSQGRTNLRTAMGNLTTSLPSMIADYQSRRRFNNLYNTAIASGMDNSQANMAAEEDLKMTRPDISLEPATTRQMLLEQYQYGGY